MISRRWVKTRCVFCATPAALHQVCCRIAPTLHGLQQAVPPVVARIAALDRREMLEVRKRLRRAWSLSGRRGLRGLSRGPQASGTPGPEEQKPSPQHREDRPEEGVALPPKGLGGTASGVPGSGPGVSGPGFPSMLERCQETAAPKDEHSQDAAPVELNQSWETAPMDRRAAGGGARHARARGAHLRAAQVGTAPGRGRRRAARAAVGGSDGRCSWVGSLGRVWS